MRKLVKFLLLSTVPVVIALVFLGWAQSRPTVNSGGVLNAASYALSEMPNGGIAQGSLFAVFGSGLGSEQLQQASTPLPTVLSGTSVSVVPSGKPSVSALMVYTSPSQIGAILPSNVPVGDAQLIVTYNGVPSSPVSIRVVASNVGIFARNQAGTGQAIVQNYKSALDQPLNSLFEPARPGQVMILWATGLGPVDFDESALPQVKDLPVATEVLVGGKSAKVLYHGRSPQFPGVDQVNFQIPDDVPEGCYVPLAVRAGGVVSNFTSIAISSGGSVCSDAHGLPEGELERIHAGAKTVIGWIQLVRISAEVSSFMGVAGLGGGVDLGFGEFFPWNAAIAVRSQPVNAGVGIPMGTCTVYPGRTDQFVPVGLFRQGRLNAGASLTINGPKGAKSLPRRAGSGLYDRQPLGAWTTPALSILPAGLAAFLDPGIYTVDNGAGNATVGAFKAATTILAPPTWTNSGAVSTVDLSQDLLITWSGGDAERQHVVIAGASYIPDMMDARAGAAFVCVARVAAGRFTVPSSVLSALPPGAAGNAAFLGVGGAAIKADRFTASGLDLGLITSMTLNAKDVTYK